MEIQRDYIEINDFSFSEKSLELKHRGPGVYQIRCLTTGMVYFGAGKNTRSRFMDHLKFLRKGTHSNRNLQYIWNKFGQENLTFEVLLKCKNVEEAFDKEIELVRNHDGLVLNQSNVRFQAGAAKHSTETKANYTSKMKNLHENGIILSTSARKAAGERMGLFNAERWSNSDFLEKMSNRTSEHMKKRWADPDYREKRVTAMKKLWEDPAYREKRSRKLK